VGNGAYLYRNGVAVDGYGGNMLFIRGVHGAGDELFHFVAAAHDGHSRTVE
jgi:hypothetical protein